MRILIQIPSTVLIALVFCGCFSASAEAAKKVALLVGVNKYQKRGLAEKPLQYAERDVTKLGVELKKQGFDVALLLGEKASKKEFEKALEVLLKDRTASDVVLLGFAGHGQQLPLTDKTGKTKKGANGKALEDAYYCPVDATMTEADSLISLTGLVETLDKKGGINLVLVDACRDNPDPTRSTRSISGNELNGRLPQNTAIIFSCSSGQQAFETIDAGGGHGVFFYHVLKGLQGEAVNRSGVVTWNSLSGYVASSVNDQTKRWFPERAKYANRGQLQTPHELRNLIQVPILASSFEDPDFALGLKLYLGEDGLMDRRQAYALFRKAADRGHALAKTFVGEQYAYGYYGLSKNQREAAQWFKSAQPALRELAENGDPVAQAQYAVMYETGSGVEKNDEMATKWYRKAANQNYAYAQTCLGTMYYEGLGVEQDYTAALKLYRKAAAQNYATAQAVVGMMYEYGRGVEKDHEEAVRWYRKAADQNHAGAQSSLGSMYYEGLGIEQDYTAALNLFRKAAEQKFPEGQARLGFMYGNGRGVEKDHEEAVKWYRKAATQNSATAQNNLGHAYWSGEGVEQNYSEAIKWYRKAADQDFIPAQYNLGRMYLNGEGVEQNYFEAVKWFRKSAEQNYAQSQSQMGFMYKGGSGVEKNLGEAIKWFRKAARQGEPTAIEQLKKLGVDP